MVCFLAFSISKTTLEKRLFVYARETETHGLLIKTNHWGHVKVKKIQNRTEIRVSFQEKMILMFKTALTLLRRPPAGPESRLRGSDADWAWLTTSAWIHPNRRSFGLKPEQHEGRSTSCCFTQNSLMPLFTDVALCGGACLIWSSKRNVSQCLGVPVTRTDGATRVVTALESTGGCYFWKHMLSLDFISGYWLKWG